MTAGPFIRRVMLWLLPPLLVVGAWQAWDYVEARRFATAGARVEARARPASARPSGAWEADEAGRFYAAAAIAFESPDTTPLTSFTTVRDAYRRAAAAGASPDETSTTLARTWIRNNEEPWMLLENAAPLEFKGFAPGTDFDYRTGSLLGLFRVSSLKTLDLLTVEDIDAAARSLVTRLRALRVFAGNAWLMVPLQEVIDDGCLVLSHPAATPAHWDAFQSAFREIEVENFLPSLLVAQERATYDTATQAFAFGLATRSVTASLTFLLERPLLRRSAIASLDAHARAIDAAALPWPQRLEVLRAIRPPAAGFERQLTRSTARDPNPYELVRAQVNVYEEMAEASASLLARVRSMNWALSGVEALDPFTGSPLKSVRENERTVVIYSVGENGMDDGGMIDGVRRQPGETAAPPLDVGVRLTIRR